MSPSYGASCVQSIGSQTSARKCSCRISRLRKLSTCRGGEGGQAIEGNVEERTWRVARSQC